MIFVLAKDVSSFQRGLFVFTLGQCSFDLTHIMLPKSIRSVKDALELKVA